MMQILRITFILLRMDNVYDTLLSTGWVPDELRTEAMLNKELHETQ